MSKNIGFKNGYAIGLIKSGIELHMKLTKLTAIRPSR